MDSRILLRRTVRLAGALLALTAALPSLPGHGSDRHRHAGGADRIAVEAVAVHAADEVHVEASSSRELERCGLCARLAPSRGALGRSLPVPVIASPARGSRPDADPSALAGAPRGAAESRGPPSH